MNKQAAGQLHANARRIVRTLRKAGFQAYYAGGCVRDMLLGRKPKDIDIATDARPDQIEALFSRTVATGRDFGVMSVVLEGVPYEVSTFRTDRPYRDGRHPEGVEFSTAEKDASRRDFTVNGLFYDPEADRILDHVGGRRDIDARLIRAIGPPDQRIQEDHLRMMRAVRLACTLDFSIDEETEAAIRRHAADLGRVSAERIQQELTRLLLEAPGRAGKGVRMLSNFGLLRVILPEVAAMAGQAQPPEFHPEGDVFTHTLMMLDAMRDPALRLAYAVLLHDVGKPATASEAGRDGDTRIRFDRHARVGSDIAEAVLRRLRLPSADVEAIAHCIRNHMRFMDVQHMRKSTLRRLVGAPTFATELELHRLDCICSHRDLSNYEFLQRFTAALEHEPALPPRWVTGKDLLAMGLEEGPEIGRWLRRAYDAQIEGRFRDREELLDWLRGALAEVDREA